MTKNIYFSLLLSAVATVSFAEETRQVDKHEHGVGELNIAIDKNIIDFEFMLPGADIVGFEYEAKSEEDLSLVSNALEKFEDYKNVFIIPAEGECNIASQEVLINQEDSEHDEHEDSEHDEHENSEHDEHKDSEHNEETHNEFYAKYSFECDSINLINKVEFPYFVTYPNSGELEVQFISELGSTSFEVEADKPVINIEGKI